MIDEILAALLPMPDPIAMFRDLAALDLSFLRAVPARRERPFRQTDVTRAFRAAKAAGITVRVDIEPNGKLSLVPISPGETAPDSDDAIVARLM